MRIGIIGGSGINPEGHIANPRIIERETPFGTTTLVLGTIADKEVVFVQRHGVQRSVPPHRINHHANIAALRTFNVEKCVGISAVGSLWPEITPGSLFVLSGFVDFSRSKVWTFYDSHPQGVVHTDFSQPYCLELRCLMAEAIGAPAVTRDCVYITVDGPRYETPSEIDMFRLLGGHVIGMTGAPEAILAREAGICYAGIAIVANPAAGLSPMPLSHEEVLRTVEKAAGRVWEAIDRTVNGISAERHCNCNINWELWSQVFEI